MPDGVIPDAAAVRAFLSALCVDKLGGKRTSSRRPLVYRIPMPRGYLVVECYVRPKWSGFYVDRWHTTDRLEERARPWFEAEVWPALDAHRSGRTWYTLPSGGTVFTGASHVRNDDLITIAEPWLRLEMGDWATSSKELRNDKRDD